ncbi:hypothetical protein GE21DRAFT_1281556 [Neurospora crassa]|nr:hypothetical protein GE21DRAFT_1281556 [Neurospora crassa]
MQINNKNDDAYACIKAPLENHARNLSVQFQPSHERLTKGKQPATRVSLKKPPSLCI